MVSLHDHPVRFPADMAQTPPYNRTGRQHTAFAGLAASGLTAVFDNMMDGTAYVTGNTPWQWDDVVTDLGMRQADIAHQDRVIVVRDPQRHRFAHATGRVGIVFGLEAATPIGNDLDKLDILFGLGIRQIGIAYSDSNGLGAGLNEPADYGLTAFGRRAVRRMNDLGLAIDVSHASDRTGIETAAASAAPVFITHAGARALWDIPRLKCDDALRAVADSGGVIGISAAPHTTISAEHPQAHDRLGHGPLPVLRRPGRTRPRRLRPRHALRRPRRPAPDVRRTARSPGHVRPRAPRRRVRRRAREPERGVPQHRRLAGPRRAHDDEITKVLGGNALRALAQIWPA